MDTVREGSARCQEKHQPKRQNKNLVKLSESLAWAGGRTDRSELGYGRGTAGSC